MNGELQRSETCQRSTDQCFGTKGHSVILTFQSHVSLKSILREREKPDPCARSALTDPDNKKNRAVFKAIVIDGAVFNGVRLNLHYKTNPE